MNNRPSKKLLAKGQTRGVLSRRMAKSCNLPMTYYQRLVKYADQALTAHPKSITILDAATFKVTVTAKDPATVTKKLKRANAGKCSGNHPATFQDRSFLAGLPVNLEFPYPHRSCPTIWVHLNCSLTGKQKIVAMVVDTGSCFSCLPLFLVPILGLNTHNIGEPTFCIGGTILRYLHPIKLSLVNPKERNLSVLWTSSEENVSFVKEMNKLRGIIGMDVISQWKEMAICPGTTGGTIKITL